jgi:hypothetical protein
VEQLEHQYWERDGVVADVIDTIIIVNPKDEEISCEDTESEEVTDFFGLQARSATVR